MLSFDTKHCIFNTSKTSLKWTSLKRENLSNKFLLKFQVLYLTLLEHKIATMTIMLKGVQLHQIRVII